MSDYRLSLQALWVLRALYDDINGDHYGFSISKATGVKSGTLYPILARLETYGLVVSRWEEVDASFAGRPPRRFYSLSAKGVQCVEQEMRKMGMEMVGQRIGVN